MLFTDFPFFVWSIMLRRWKGRKWKKEMQRDGQKRWEGIQEWERSG